MIYTRQNGVDNSSLEFFTDVKQSDFLNNTQYLSVNGEIAYINTFGYLNAERYPMIAFYEVSLLVYVIICLVWLVASLR